MFVYYFEDHLLINELLMTTNHHHKQHVNDVYNIPWDFKNTQPHSVSI